MNTNYVEDDQKLESIAIERLICPRCEVLPQNRCKTISGKTTKTHASRVSPLFEAYELGREHAILEMS